MTFNRAKTIFNRQYITECHMSNCVQDQLTLKFSQSNKKVLSAHTSLGLTRTFILWCSNHYYSNSKVIKYGVTMSIVVTSTCNMSYREYFSWPQTRMTFRFKNWVLMNFCSQFTITNYINIFNIASYYLHN